MPPDPPSNSPLRRSKWALSRPYCQYPELCHARAYKQKKARNAPESHLKLDLDRLKIAVNKYEDEIRTRGVPGKLVMLFSAFGHIKCPVGDELLESVFISKTYAVNRYGFDLPENCCVSEPQW